MACDLAPQTISRLLSEIRDLIRNPIEGISYVESDDNSLSEIHAIISGPGALMIPTIELSSTLDLTLQRKHPISEASSE